MNPIQLLQDSLSLKPDGAIGKITFGALRMKWDLTPIELAHFLGQCEHETAGFSVWEENLNYSAAGLRKIFAGYYTDELLAVKHQRKPSVIANHVYGGRMGNVNPNDGWHFKGRGAIQLTGRSNYTLFSKSVNDLSILQTPGLVAAKYAFESGIWFFNTNNLFKLCVDLSEETILKISRGVNLGNPKSKTIPNGFEDRKAKTLKYAHFII